MAEFPFLNQQAKISDKLSTDEIELYDRQIRLWGMEAQQKIRSTKVLVVNLSGVGTEIVKNLVLSGIKEMYILDTSLVKQEDLSTQFFLEHGSGGSGFAGSAGPAGPAGFTGNNASYHAGTIFGLKKLDVAIKHIRDLNPRVNVIADTTTKIHQLLKEYHSTNAADTPEVKEEKKSRALNFFKQFNLVITTQFDTVGNLRLNSITRKLKMPFYSVATNGLFGHFFSDLIEYQPLPNKSKSDKYIDYPKLKYYPYQTLLSLNEINSPFRNLRQRQLNLKKKRILVSIFIFCSIQFNLKFPDQVELDFDSFFLEVKQMIYKLGLENDIFLDPFLHDLVNIFINNYGCDFSPTCAILGGALSQDIINMLSFKNLPVNNFLVLDGLSSEMPIYLIIQRPDQI